MSLSSIGSRSLSGILLVLSGAVLCAQAPAASPAPQKPNSTVIFSRSIDENGTEHSVDPLAAAPQNTAVAESKSPAIPEDDRTALRISSYDLALNLRLREGQIAVRANLAVTNTGSKPLVRIPLDLSSTLNWEIVESAGHKLRFAAQRMNSDVDHTGQLSEALVDLDQPLAPGATLHLDLGYSGAIALSAQRLTAIGTPKDQAQHSDWDRIALDFTGLRGFGNVLWYPAIAPPALLGDGARLFDLIGDHKLRNQGASFHLRLAAEFPHGAPPNIALINGHPVELKITESGILDQSQEVDGIASAELPATTLGFEAPSLFLAMRTAHPGQRMVIWSTEADPAPVAAWSSAAEPASAFVESWLGTDSRTALQLLDLPEAGDTPFEAGSMLALPLAAADDEQMESTLVHAFAHASIHSPQAWLNEGAAQFLSSLWTERQKGRTQALGLLEAGRQPLSLAEPSSPGVGAGQPLTQAIAPVYYRSKAVYAFWMLRDIVGDQALAAALRSINAPAKAGSPIVDFRQALESASEQKDLGWFFADWVDADHGLPDLSIDGAFPTSASAGNWLVAVNVSNAGYAQALVPVTVHSTLASVTQRLMVPAHGKAVIRILVQGKPVMVQLNDGTVPESAVSMHETKLEVAPPPVNQPQKK